MSRHNRERRMRRQHEQAQEDRRLFHNIIADCDRWPSKPVLVLGRTGRGSPNLVTAHGIPTEIAYITLLDRMPEYRGPLAAMSVRLYRMSPEEVLGKEEHDAAERSMLRPDGTPGWRILRAIMLEDGRQVPLTDPGATW
jgi:hypothetical protein